MSFDFYTVEYLRQPGRRNHVAIFIESNEDGDEILYHVVRSILMGMGYQRRKSHNYARSVGFVRVTDILVGQVQAADLSRFDAICDSVPAPCAQLNLNGSPIDASKPLRRCIEWIKEVVEQAVAEGVVKK